MQGDCCKICFNDDTIIPYTTEQLCDNGCKFHIDCIDYERYAPIFKYGPDETKPEQKYINHCDQTHGRRIPWHELKAGPFIWKRSDNTVRAEGTLATIRTYNNVEPGDWIPVKYGIFATKSNPGGYYGYVLHGPYTEYDEIGFVNRLMNYDMGSVVGSCKFHGPRNVISMEQEMAPGGKVHGLRTIQLNDRTKITENWRYGVIHGTRTIKKGDGSGTTIEEYENGHLISQVEETYIGGRIIRKEIPLEDEGGHGQTPSKWTWFLRKLKSKISR